MVTKDWIKSGMRYFEVGWGDRDTEIKKKVQECDEEGGRACESVSDGLESGGKESHRMAKKH